jgi:phosphopantetheinyl transferase
LAERQALNEHSQIVLQGAVDKMLEEIKSQNERILEGQKQVMQLAHGARSLAQMAHEASMQEKEIVRDEKGKAQGVRAKRVAASSSGLMATSSPHCF